MWVYFDTLLVILGITFGCDGEGKAAFVAKIKHGSPAAHTPGLELNMELTSVNGQKVKKWGFDDVLGLIGTSTARPLRLTFSYGSTYKTIKTLAPQVSAPPSFFSHYS